MEVERMERRGRVRINRTKEGKRGSEPRVLRLTADPESGSTGVSSSEVEPELCLCLHSNEQAGNFQRPAAPEFPPYTWRDTSVRKGVCFGLWEIRGTLL